MAAQAPPPTTAPVRQTSPLGTLQGLLEKYKDQIAIALPKHLTAERMIRVALTAVGRNALLAQCSQLSIAACIVQASILGLEPDGLTGEAYLIPYWNSKLEVKLPNGQTKKGGYECQLQPGYLGLVKLARNSGEFSVIDAQPVHENDDFDFEKGSDIWWRHKWPKSGPRGRIIGYWAGFVLKDGSKNFDYWTVEQIEDHRDKYSQGAYKKSGGNFVLDEKGEKVLQGPWRDSPDWMFRKTPLKQVLKLAPKSAEMRAAIALNESHEAGIRQQFTVDVPLELQPPPEDTDDDPRTVEMPQRISQADVDKALSEKAAKSAVKEYADFASAPDPMELADGAQIKVGGKLFAPNSEKTAYSEVKA